MILALEWAAYLGVAVATWLYAYPGPRGPLAGVVAASVFILYGVTTANPAAWVTNAGFLAIHCRNLVRAL